MTTEIAGWGKQVGELDRRTYVGGSDVAAILGLAPYDNTTPLTAYLKKAGLLVSSGLEDPAKAKVLRRGIRMEPLVVDMLIEDEGVKVTKRSSRDNQNRYTDPVYPFMAAEVDFEFEVTAGLVEAHNLPTQLLGTIQNGEVKTSHPFAFKGKWGEAGTEDVPIEYACQATHGLGVTDRQLTLVAVLVGSDNLLIYWVYRDDVLLAEMRRRVADFWINNVVPRVPPAPVNLPDVYQLFRQKPASTIEASPDIVEAVRQLAAASAEVARLSGDGGVIEDLKFKIGSFMLGAAQMDKPEKPGKHLLTLSGLEILSVTFQQQSRIDQKALQKEAPEIADRFRKATNFFVFRPKKGALT